MKEIKFLKRILKKRKSFTVQILIFFLITGSIGYGIEVSEDYKNEIIIKESEETGLFLKGDNLNITNNGVILGNRVSFPSGWSTWGSGIEDHKSSGAGTSSSIGNIINNGFIKGYSHFNAYSGVGNGISSFSSAQNSSLGNLDNTGVIIGEVKHAPGGNGIEVYAGKNTQTGNINNKGVIKGISDDGSSSSGNGIRINGKINNIGKIKNEGVISGNSYPDNTLFSEGNGILIRGESSLILIENKGTISGYAFDKYNHSGKGTGIAIPYSKINDLKLNNYGVIKGKKSALTYNDITSISYNNNYGILAGENIVDSGQVKPSNLGIEILIDSTGNVTNIENGIGGEVVLEDGTKKVIINGQRYDENNHTTDQANLAKDSYIIANGSNYENNIINGAGINEGALIVKAGTSINDSIVNGYNTAIYLENSSQLTATNTIFNGGGLKNDVAVIKGSMGDNVASISGASIINGAVNLQDGNDTLSIANTVQINGELDGGTGNDILNLGETSITKVTPNLNILHDIKGFENVNTNGNITLFETTKITGADKINLESGNLVLRVDPTIIANGKVTGHALYENNGTLTSNGGNLIVGLNGLGEGTIISMGGTTITPDTDDSWWKDTDHIKTNSLVLDGKLSADGKDIYITVLESIPLEPSNPVPPTDPQPPINPPIEPEPPVNPPISPEPPVNPPTNPEPPINPPIEPEPPVNPPISPESPIVIDSLLYEKLNKIYQSIVAAGEIGNLANTTLLENKTYNESLGGLLTILDQMYANNPYAYTVKSSRDSLKLFEDNMSYLTIKPKKEEMIVQGKAIYTGVKNDSGAYGKNYYGFDTGHRNYKTTTNTVGGLATFEYGLSDKTSVGAVLGGNSQDINFKGSSKIKGNSLYLGTFAKTDINNFKFMGGVGYQYTSADADRKVSNRYDSFSTGDRYDINSLNAFVEAKYIYNAEQDWTVEPKVRLSYYYIEQDKVNEGYTPGQISMRTDKINSNTADVETGVDFVKSLYLNNGKLKNILSLGVINTIGDKSKELNGYILGKEKDGKKFDIQGVELPKTSGKVSYSLELEQTNGMIYTAGVSLEFAKDYNRNVNVTVGIGYKF